MVVRTLLGIFAAIGFVVVVLVLPAQSGIETELLQLQGIVGEQRPRHGLLYRPVKDTIERQE